MRLIKKLFLLQKKILLVFCLFGCFMLQEVKANLMDYIVFAYCFDERFATQQEKQKFVEVQAFFVRLVERLFYEKHDSALVKQLFLCAKAPYAELIGCLYLGYYGEYFCKIRDFTCQNVLDMKLNLYRLGFLTPTAIRLQFWDFRAELAINSEQQYKTVLTQTIAQFCDKYGCDQDDKKVFDQLVNYEFTPFFVNNTRWDEPFDENG